MVHAQSVGQNQYLQFHTNFTKENQVDKNVLIEELKKRMKICKKYYLKAKIDNDLVRYNYSAGRYDAFNCILSQLEDNQ